MTEMNSQRAIDILQNANLGGVLRQAADYAVELLEKQERGLLVVLPCKLDVDIFRVYGGRVHEGWQTAYAEVFADGIVVIDDSDNGFEADDIGKTVFLTREEAEAALKREV